MTHAAGAQRSPKTECACDCLCQEQVAGDGDVVCKNCQAGVHDEYFHPGRCWWNS